MLNCHCERCGYNWISRHYSRPIRCAKCRAWSWWRPKLPKKIRPEPGPVGRPRKYYVGHLNVGQQARLEYDKNITSMKQSINAYAIRAGKKFVLTSEPACLLVRRVI